MNFSLLGEGGVLDTAERVLIGNQPMVGLPADLFDAANLPEDVAVVARTADGPLITGTSFAFDSAGQPSMSTTFSAARTP